MGLQWCFLWMIAWELYCQLISKFLYVWWSFLIPWNSMELLIFPKKVPWNSMEFHGTFLKFHGIPWNLINFIFKKIIFRNIVFGLWLMIRCYVAKISQKLYILHWFQYLNSYFEHPSVSENGTMSAKMACCSFHLSKDKFHLYSVLIQTADMYCKHLKKKLHTVKLYILVTCLFHFFLSFIVTHTLNPQIILHVFFSWWCW